ncbi:hypothetical protein ACIRH0_44220 [Streptomyces sp. NPDC093675]|uniref:hypothetical protein n=1 Tax=Streptomyces sp. NPDC093675 TaxID=3366049 RepID=UPI0037F4767D
MYSAKAAGKVDFTVAERCLTECGTFDSAHAKNWPDVPFDQYCASGTECKDRYSLSFWTRKRLTQIDTSILTGGLYKPVDTWTLTHQFPSPGNGTDPALWLASITRTGHTGTGDVSMPPVTFRGQTLPNRVEGATTGGDPDPVPPMWRYRIYGIDTESGGTIGVTYSPTDCAAGDVPSPSSNTRRCYPIIWSPPDAPDDNYEPYLDWFHTYVVTQVLESDNTGGAPVKQTDYTYLGGMAWAKSKDDEFTKAKHLTYSDRKGYGRVQVRSGAGSDARTLKEYRYFRGIEGAEVKDSEGVAVTDQEAFAGMMREDATYNGDDGELETTVSYEPWRSAATATEACTGGLPARYAYAVGGKSEKTRTAVGTGWRTTQTSRTFDAVGQPLTESDLGDTAKSGDEECATTTYARNTTANILTLIAEIKTVAKHQAKKAADERKRKAAAEKRKKDGILGSIMKSNTWNQMSPGGRFFVLGIIKAPGYLWDHEFLAGSACVTACLNLGFQRGAVSFGLTGGITFGGRSGLLKGPAGNYAGISSGINTAVPSDQGFQVGSITAAENRLGGNLAWGKRKSGGGYYAFGWSGGKGVALQGPTLLGGMYIPGSGWTWTP